MIQKEHNLKSFFTNPSLELNNITLDLHKRLKEEVANEIIAFVQLRTDEAKERIHLRLKSRYEDIYELDQSMPDQPTKEDQNRYLSEFFRLTDPGAVARELKAALKFDEIETEYRLFIQEMSTQEYGELFKRYDYPSSFFHAIRQAMLNPIHLVTNTLKSYTESLAKHALLLEEITKGKRDRPFIKGGASLLGMLIGIPFAGAGIGALMRGNDQNKINDSLKRLFEQWDTYVDRFNQFLNELGDHYELALITIYGGTLLRVHEQLNVYHYTFDTLALLSRHYSLTITSEEQRKTANWMKKTTSGIENLLHKKNWKEAIKISKELYNIAKQRPIIARTELYDGKSALYIAHLSYYLSYQEALLEEYRNGYRQSFFNTCIKLYDELPLLILDRHIPDGFSKQSGLLLRFIKEGLHLERIEDIKAVVRYIENLVKRWEKEGVYKGELAGTEPVFIEDIKLFIFIEHFLADVLNIELEIGFNQPRLRLTSKQLKELKKADQEIGIPDLLTTYLKSQYLKSIFLPWRNPFFTQMFLHKKKLAAGFLSCSLLYGSFVYGPALYEISKNKLAEFYWFSTEKKNAPSAIQPQKYITLTVERANIRSSRSLDSKIIAVVTINDKLKYLNKEQKGSDGENWYFVELANGNRGWVSGTISSR